MICSRWSAGPAAALAMLLCAAAATPPRMELPPPWPSARPDDADLAAVWPIDRRLVDSDPFAAATRTAPLPPSAPLPLRHCGIADCLRPAPDARFVEQPEGPPRLSDLLTTLPVAIPLDHRHAVIGLVALALLALVWRNRSRRARATY